jgi:hypothetical protein
MSAHDDIDTKLRVAGFFVILHDQKPAKTRTRSNGNFRINPSHEEVRSIFGPENSRWSMKEVP